jgi:glycerol-3-phosphate dehydrogenase
MKISVLGAGTWGIALARLLSNKGYDVVVWSAIANEIEYLKKNKKHPKLKDMDIPTNLDFTANIEKACTDKDIIVFAVPSIFVRSVAKQIKPFISDRQVIVDVAKGIEKDTLLTFSEVIFDELNSNHDLSEIKVVALSGPTHAEEVALDIPTTIVSACSDYSIAKFVQDTFMTESFRVYSNTDIKGVELGGALKNIIALACGISKGMGYGDNTIAAIITRGISEITKLGLKMGCREKTFSGLSGIGDMVVTCTSRHSRNNKAGMLIGKGMPVDDAVKSVGMVVEGINAIEPAIGLAKKYNVEMPIVFAVNDIINKQISVELVVNQLMTRYSKMED